MLGKWLHFKTSITPSDATGEHSVYRLSWRVHAHVWFERGTWYYQVNDTALGWIGFGPKNALTKRSAMALARKLAAAHLTYIQR